MTFEQTANRSKLLQFFVLLAVPEIIKFDKVGLLSVRVSSDTSAWDLLESILR